MFPFSLLLNGMQINAWVISYMHLCLVLKVISRSIVRELSDIFVYLFSDEFKMTQELLYQLEFGTLIPKMLSVFPLTFTFMVKIQVKARGTA